MFTLSVQKYCLVAENLLDLTVLLWCSLLLTPYLCKKEWLLSERPSYECAMKSKKNINQMAGKLENVYQIAYVSPHVLITLIFYIREIVIYQALQQAFGLDVYIYIQNLASGGLPHWSLPVCRTQFTIGAWGIRKREYRRG